MILAALSFIVASWQRLVLYLVEEAFTVLLGIAVILTLAWITLTAFLLLWQGASLVFLQLKRIFIVARSQSRVSSAETDSAGDQYR